MWYPYFQVFSKNRPFPRHQSANTQYARCPANAGNGAKQNMAPPEEKGPRHPVGRRCRRPPLRAGRSAHRKAAPKRPQRRYGLRQQVLPGLSGSQCSRCPLLKGAVLPGGCGPNGSVNRLENRRRICSRQPFSGSRTPIRRFPALPHRPRAPQPLPPPAGDGTSAVYNVSGVDGQFPRRLLFLKEPDTCP